MESIINAVLVVGLIGLAFGILLALAAVIFKVEKDPRIEQIEEILPGANCGACGFAGCSAYAEAVVNGAPVNCCGVGGSSAAQQIGGIMGIAVAAGVQKVARVKCAGDCNAAKDKYEYYGILDCLAASKLSGGQKACEYGCLGYGSCVNACQFGAISIKDGIAVVDEDRCTACGACVVACPKKLIELLPKDNKTTVLCMNKKSGKEVISVCAKGCIGCRICEKNCPSEAMTVENNLAKINYDKCTSCGICREKCPKNVIK